MAEKKRVLMICLGNTCRSPIAEAVFRDYIQRNQLTDSWEVDSAALFGYHTGKPPNPRAMDTLKNHHVTEYNHLARSVKSSDFEYYDWMLGMDYDNIIELERKKPVSCRAQIELLGSYDLEGETIIRDPYFDDDSAGFEKAYEQCVKSVQLFISKHNQQ